MSATESSRTRITVLITTYNHEAYIEECLLSVLQQEQSKIMLEVVVVDDCSSDKTWDIIGRLRESNPGIIKIHRNSKNLGSQGQLTFLKHIHDSKSDFIAFCDGDDYWMDICKLQKQLTELQSNPKIGLVHTEYLILDETRPKDGLKMRNLKDVDKARDTRKRRKFVQGNDTKFSTVMIRKNALHWKFLEGALGTLAFDWIICVSIALRYHIKYLPLVTAVHRIHSGGVWNGSTRYEREMMKKEVRTYCARNLPRGFLSISFKARIVRDSLREIVRRSRAYSFFKPAVLWMRSKKQ